MKNIRERKELLLKKINHYILNKENPDQKLFNNIFFEFDLEDMDEIIDNYKNKLENMKRNVKTRRIIKHKNPLSKLHTILLNKYENLIVSQQPQSDLFDDLCQKLNVSNEEDPQPENSLENTSQQEEQSSSNQPINKFFQRSFNNHEEEASIFDEVFGSNKDDEDCTSKGLTSFNPLSKILTSERNSDDYLNNQIENISVDSAKLMQTIDEFF